MTVGTLTLGLAAGIAVFTYRNGYFRPFPGADPDGLVQIFEVDGDDRYGSLSYLDWLDYSMAGMGAFEGVAAVQSSLAASVRLETMADVVFGEAVSGDLFDLLGVEMSLGRRLQAEDDVPGADPAVVVSHAYWQSRFAGSPDVLGQTIYLNFRPFTIIGVASERFLGSRSGARPDVWIPTVPYADRYTNWASASERRDVPLVRAVARLADGVEPDQALSELRNLARGLDEAYPRAGRTRELRIEPATWISPQARVAEMPTVRLMMAAALGLLLLVCANVANLLLALAAGRGREMALRAALGASPASLLRRVLVENVVLASAAGAIALSLAVAVSSRLGSYFARPSVWGANVTRELTIDGNVVLFAVLVSILTGLIAGLLPAARASRREVVAGLQGGPGGGERPRRAFGWRVPGLRDALVSTQVGLSVVLLVVAGLVSRTLGAAGDIDPGFSYDGLLASYVSTSSTELPLDERHRFFDELTRRVREEPWVAAATVSDNAPLSGHASRPFRIDGQDEPVQVTRAKVNPDYFQTLQMEVLRGRLFEAQDTVGSRPVAVVNERFAERFFGSQDVVGQSLWMAAAISQEADRDLEIVGVVEDAKVQDFLAETEPVVYVPLPQEYSSPGNALVVRVRGDPAAAVPRLTTWLRDFEPYIAIVNIAPYDDVVGGFLYAQRMNAELFMVLAGLGLALAVVGLFSVTSMAVARRTREIGVRMALGASRVEVGRAVLGRAMMPVAVGLGLGLAGALVLKEAVRSLLYGVEPTDPLSIAVGLGILVATALLAASLPTRRAVAVHPIEALKTE